MVKGRVQVSEEGGALVLPFAKHALSESSQVNVVNFGKSVCLECTRIFVAYAHAEACRKGVSLMHHCISQYWCWPKA